MMLMFTYCKTKTKQLSANPSTVLFTFCTKEVWLFVWLTKFVEWSDIWLKTKSGWFSAGLKKKQFLLWTDLLDVRHDGSLSLNVQQFDLLDHLLFTLALSTHRRENITNKLHDGFCPVRETGGNVVKSNIWDCLPVGLNKWKTTTYFHMGLSPLPPLSAAPFTAPFLTFLFPETSRTSVERQRGGGEWETN